MRVFTFTTIIQDSSGSPSYSNQKKKKKKDPDWKRRSKALTVCRWHDNIENPKESIRKLLEITSEFRKVAGYQINAQKSLAFLYTNSENQKEQLRNQYRLPLQQK